MNHKQCVSTSRWFYSHYEKLIIVYLQCAYDNAGLLRLNLLFERLLATQRKTDIDIFITLWLIIYTLTSSRLQTKWSVIKTLNTCINDNQIDLITYDQSISHCSDLRHINRYFPFQYQFSFEWVGLVRKPHSGLMSKQYLNQWILHGFVISYGLTMTKSIFVSLLYQCENRHWAWGTTVWLPIVSLDN